VTLCSSKANYCLAWPWLASRDVQISPVGLGPGTGIVCALFMVAAPRRHAQYGSMRSSTA
jgi:hypothetical protein